MTRQRHRTAVWLCALTVVLSAFGSWGSYEAPASSPGGRSGETPAGAEQPQGSPEAVRGDVNPEGTAPPGSADAIPDGTPPGSADLADSDPEGMPAGSADPLERRRLFTSGWRGSLSLFGVPVPNWAVPVSALLAAIACAVRMPAGFRVHPWSALAAAAYGWFHLLSFALVLRRKGDMTVVILVAVVAQTALVGLVVLAQRRGGIRAETARHAAS